MRLGKATIVLALMGCLLQGVVIAQQEAGFEALLSDIGKEPAAVSTSAPEATTQSTGAPLPEAVAEPVASEPVAAEPLAALAIEEVTNTPAAEPAAGVSPEATTGEPLSVETVPPVTEGATIETAMPAVEAQAVETTNMETISLEPAAGVSPEATTGEPFSVEMVPPVTEGATIETAMPAVEAQAVETTNAEALSLEPAAGVSPEATTGEPFSVEMVPPVTEGATIETAMPAVEAQAVETTNEVEAQAVETTNAEALSLEPAAGVSPEATGGVPISAEMAPPVTEGATIETAMPAVEAQAPETTNVEAITPPAEVVIQPAAESVQPVTAEAPVQKNVAEVKPAGTEEEAITMAAQEEVRRRAMELQGLKSLEAGYKAMSASDFEGAMKSFDDALANLPQRPARVEDRGRATWGLAEANYRLALDIYRKQGNLQEAKQNTERALNLVPDHKGAASLLEKIKSREEFLSRPLPPPKRPDVVEKKKTIAQLMSEGKQYFGIKDYNRAETLFEKVLLEDEYNADAMRYLKKIGDIRYAIRTKERDAAAAGMMQEVRKAWNIPIRKEVQLPETVTGGAVVQTKTGTQRLQDKMAKIIIPSIEFRQANINDVINFLVEESIRQDAEGAGVNIILNMSIPGQEGSSAPAAAPSENDPFAETPSGEGGLGAVPGVSTGVKTITLNLRRISLLDAIKYITEVASLKFRLEDNAVIITPAGVVSGHVITRMYPVQPSILDVVIQKGETKEKTGEFIEMGGGQTTIKRGDVKDFFEKSGVPFPVGTSITYNPTISQLIVANTPENLDTFERILAQLNVIPSQIEIEARFVEVGENDLEELGLQWMLTDNWEIAENASSGPVGGRERVQINADQDGFSKGLRFFGFDQTTAAIDPASTVTRSTTASPLGGILSAASVLTNPQLKVILQALSQHGNADLLSAPRVTTKNGVNAQIQIVKEIIYPTEFEVTQPTVQSQGDLVTPPTVTPGSFETREVGVILNVTPAVGPDGYTIDLTMVPEVAELVDWIQYGSSITINGDRFVYNIPQPVFSSRNATTSIVIWDGQTVVMGGLIREELVTIRDKIPFLGDIPIIGRLFRSEGQSSKKTNLLIFVTARLVDPAGKPIHKAEAMAMPGGGSQAQAQVGGTTK